MNYSTFSTGSLEGLNMVSSDGTELAIADVDHDFGVVANPAGCMATLNNNNNNGKSSEMKFEQTRVASATSTKITHGDGYSSEEATANASHSRRLQADGLHYEESGQAAAMKARLEMDGVTAEKAAAVKQVRFLFLYYFLSNYKCYCFLRGEGFVNSGSAAAGRVAVSFLRAHFKTALCPGALETCK